VPRAQFLRPAKTRSLYKAGSLRIIEHCQRMALNQQMLQHSSWHEGSEKYVAWNISIGTREGKRSFI
jgi:hypothetical protein